MADGISTSYGLESGIITSTVQFGFILGTLGFAFLNIADRFSPSKVFMVCAFLGATLNAMIPTSITPSMLLVLRFSTGFFLAGIYPVGIKIASDYHEKGLGVALGFLVGALVVGTAFPHLLQDMFSSYPWAYVMYISSGLAAFGGMIIGFGVANGPFRKTNAVFDPSSFIKVFKIQKFRSASIGYFGHMWELYAFWAFLPVYLEMKSMNQFAGSTLIFFLISIGGIGCVIGGYVAKKWSSESVASISLGSSLICCLLSPFALQLPDGLFLIFLFFWGIAVIMDSPQFSTLVAQAAPKESVGTGITIVNSLGFAISILSITLLSNIDTNQYLFLWLGVGPFIGLIFFKKSG